MQADGVHIFYWSVCVDKIVFLKNFYDASENHDWENAVELVNRFVASVEHNDFIKQHVLASVAMGRLNQPKIVVMLCNHLDWYLVEHVLENAIKREEDHTVDLLIESIHLRNGDASALNVLVREKSWAILDKWMGNFSKSKLNFDVKEKWGSVVNMLNEKDFDILWSLIPFEAQQGLRQVSSHNIDFQNWLNAIDQKQILTKATRIKSTRNKQKKM